MPFIRTPAGESLPLLVFAVQRAKREKSAKKGVFSSGLFFGKNILSNSALHTSIGVYEGSMCANPWHSGTYRSPWGAPGVAVRLAAACGATELPGLPRANGTDIKPTDLHTMSPRIHMTTLGCVEEILLRTGLFTELK